MGMAELTREELEAMDRDDLKALLDERGIEYSPHAHTPTLVDLALGDPDAAVEETADEAAADEEVEDLAQVEAPDFYQPQTYHPYELPANTVAAQAYIDRGLVVDDTLEMSEERTAAAQNEIELYGHPDDPRLSGGSVMDLDTSTPPSRQVEIEVAEAQWEAPGLTWGQLQEAEAEPESEEAEKEEANA